LLGHGRPTLTSAATPMLADGDVLPVDPRRPLCDLALERFDDRAGALRLRDVLERLIAGWVTTRVVGPA
jgi:hypothetical protein